MSDQKNLILAVIAAVAILMGFQIFYEAPREHARLAQQQAQAPAQGAPASPVQTPGVATVPGAAPQSVAPAGVPQTRESVIGQSPRIKVEGKRLHGSLPLKGSRIDDLTLADYRTEVDPKSPEIVLLSPAGAKEPYYAEFGWTAAGGQRIALPGPETQWEADGTTLAVGRPVTLTWRNGQGLTFQRIVSIDENYMFTVVQRVRNEGSEPVSLYPFALVSRHGTPVTQGFYILHEGPLGVLNDKLVEHSYSDLQDKGREAQESNGGWIGITDKYWLTALVPDQASTVTASFNHASAGPNDHKYQVDLLGQATTVAPGASVENRTRLFAGAKEVRLLDAYENEQGIKRFDLTIDWGWFYFLTKPIFYAIDYLNRLFGNFGLAILGLTVIIKTLFLPLAYKSYVSMSAMKRLQPKMLELRERLGDDRVRLNQEMMELYKREKVNPAAGCLPILLQIPVFFALYKVLFVTIEMRHAPFYGWIKDLSAPDPTSWINLFGLLPFDVPNLGPIAFLSLGIWPILMGVSMWLQMKLNPQPPDPIQAKIFALMPIMFTFMLGTFPAGLVIYWTWNNLLSIAQQWSITKRLEKRKHA